MGVLGYFTGHNAPAGQGATENRFINNNITLMGVYCAEGIIIGDESEDTLIEGNEITIKSEVIYGIYFEMSQKSTARKNNLKLNAQAIYAILGYASSDNIIENNIVNANGSFAYGILLLNGNYDEIKNNIININASGNNLTFRNLDSIKEGIAGVYLKANATHNEIENNSITINKNYAILVDEQAVDNVIIDNYLDSPNGVGDDGVNNTKLNTVEYNYKYIADASVNDCVVKYLQTGIFNITFENAFDGDIVKFYNLDKELLGESIVENGSAVYAYDFDESYAPANYQFKAKLFKKYYKVSDYKIDVTVTKGDLTAILQNSSIIQGDTDYISVKLVNSLGNPVSGAIVEFKRISSRNVLIGSAVSDSMGIAKVLYEVPASLDVGKHQINTAISGLSEYNNIQVKGNLTVLPRLNVTFEVIPNVYVGGVFAYLKDSNNNVVANKKTTVKIASTTISITSNSNGELVLPNDVGDGNFQVTISSQALGKYNENSTSFNLKVVSPIIGGSNYNMYYGNTLKYRVQIFDVYGNPLNGATVTFNINGKSVNAVSVGGYATFTSKLSVGKYTLTASYAGHSISNSIVIKSVLSAKNIVKKKAKKIKFSVKLLNKNGKVAKNKKITFKIKSKKYTAKTNKKGVATVTIKNLKVGKHTITSSYSGCSIKNTIKIKK